jgi:ribosomal protein L7/L12
MALDPAAFLREALRRGIPLDAVLAALRQHGATPIESIKAVREVRGVGLGEAKQLVSTSPAWDDIREEHERFVEEIVAAFQADA